MVDIQMKEFDDELQTMEELMDEEEISLSDSSLKVPITTLHLKRAVVVETGTALNKCIEKMLARKFGCLLVVKDGKYIGIFTERDVLMKVVGQKIDLKTAKIDDFMSRDPLRLKMDDTVEAALRLMVEKRYRHICIVDDQETPVSVLSIKDIVGFIVDFFPQDVLNLPPHPIRIGTKNRYGA